jgi:hypothetical protein
MAFICHRPHFVARTDAVHKKIFSLGGDNATRTLAQIHAAV